MTRTVCWSRLNSSSSERLILFHHTFIFVSFVIDLVDQQRCLTNILHLYRCFTTFSNRRLRLSCRVRRCIDRKIWATNWTQSRGSDVEERKTIPSPATCTPRSINRCHWTRHKCSVKSSKGARRSLSSTSTSRIMPLEDRVKTIRLMLLILTLTLTHNHIELNEDKKKKKNNARRLWMMANRYEDGQYFVLINVFSSYYRSPGDRSGRMRIGRRIISLSLPLHVAITKVSRSDPLLILIAGMSNIFLPQKKKQKSATTNHAESEEIFEKDRSGVGWKSSPCTMSCRVVEKPTCATKSCPIYRTDTGGDDGDHPWIVLARRKVIRRQSFERRPKERNGTVTMTTRKRDRETNENFIRICRVSADRSSTGRLRVMFRVSRSVVLSSSRLSARITRPTQRCRSVLRCPKSFFAIMISEVRRSIHSIEQSISR